MTSEKNNELHEVNSMAIDRMSKKSNIKCIIPINSEPLGPSIPSSTPSFVHSLSINVVSQQHHHKLASFTVLDFLHDFQSYQLAFKSLHLFCLTRLTDLHFPNDSIWKYASLAVRSHKNYPGFTPSITVLHNPHQKYACYQEMLYKCSWIIDK